MTRRQHNLKILKVYEQRHVRRSQRSRRQRFTRQRATQRAAVISASAVNNSVRLRTTLMHGRKCVAESEGSFQTLDNSRRVKKRVLKKDLRETGLKDLFVIHLKIVHISTFLFTEMFHEHYSLVLRLQKNTFLFCACRNFSDNNIETVCKRGVKIPSQYLRGSQTTATCWCGGVVFSVSALLAATFRYFSCVCSLQQSFIF